MTGAQYLLNRIAELEGAVAMLIDQKALIECERDELKAKVDAVEKAKVDAVEKAE